MKISRRKVAIIGEFSVGKTSLVRRFTTGIFEENYHATLGVQLYNHSSDVTSSSGEFHQFDQVLWDVEGGLHRRPLIERYLVGAAGAVIVSDITRSDTVDAMAEYAKMFAAVCPGRPIIFAVNKVDLYSGDTPSQIPTLEQTFDTEVFMTSAKMDEQVNKIFSLLALKIVTLGL